MSSNDFNDPNENSGQNPQGGQVPPDSSGSNAPQYEAPRYNRQNQPSSSSQNAAWQQVFDGQNPNGQGPMYPGPEYLPPQPGPAFRQYPGANQQMPNYQPYMGPDVMPPAGPQGYYYPPAPNRKWNTLCIIGFVLSFLMPVIGLVLSVVALVQINRTGEKSKGMAIAGIVISALSTALNIILVIVLVSAFGSAVNHRSFDYSGCHGSDCGSNPFDDGDDPDDDNEDTDYTYYLYDYAAENSVADITALPSAV